VRPTRNRVRPAGAVTDVRRMRRSVVGLMNNMDLLSLYMRLSGCRCVWVCAGVSVRAIYVGTIRLGAPTPKTRKPQQVACVVTGADLSCIVYKTRALGRLRNVPI